LVAVVWHFHTDRVHCPSFADQGRRPSWPGEHLHLGSVRPRDPVIAVSLAHNTSSSADLSRCDASRHSILDCSDGFICCRDGRPNSNCRIHAIAGHYCRQQHSCGHWIAGLPVSPSRASTAMARIRDIDPGFFCRPTDHDFSYCVLALPWS
jgi:hypothetical protein